jgi:CheY-like chemotaxis protein
MPIIQTRLLIVDDEPAIRTSMSLALKEIGYEVRAAEDGFSALAEFRKEIPDVLVSDLSMPGMSGFELLSVVRRRFPMMNTVAMSGAFCGDEVPSGVAAHAFYQKGSSTGSLLKILRGFPQTERSLFRQPATSVPIWIQSNGRDSSGAPFVSIACPECLRTFPQFYDSSSRLQIRDTDCAYCRCPIRFALVEPIGRGPAQFFETRTSDQKQKPAPAAQLFY